MIEQATARSRENTRARLVAAAAEVFAESGLDGASVEAICERAGFTRGAFYSNFATKEELFFALVQWMSEQKMARVSARIRELEVDGTPRLEPAEIVSRVLATGSDDGPDVILMSEIRTHAMRDSRLAGAYLEWQTALTAGVARIIEDVAGWFRLRLRMPASEAARLLVLNWEATLMFAEMTRLSSPETLELLTQRTAMLAQALADPMTD
jgi:AcrR family transcriptional regulator